jgi:MFS transporter, FSR family, fosmidomycin resistance protein
LTASVYGAIGKRTLIAPNLFVYGSLHAVIDFACVAVLFSAERAATHTVERMTLTFIVYNLLAFGSQIIFGLITDRLHSPRQLALTGGILTILATLSFNYLPMTSIILAGIGNAFFHVGAGAISLNLTPKKATAPGIFVAPGAIGLFLGTIVGRSGNFTPVIPVSLVITLLLCIYLIESPTIDYHRERIPESQNNRYLLVLSALLLAIALRSLVGLSVVFPWKANPVMAALLVTSIVAGKGMGGVIADKLGWFRVACGSLIASMPLLVFFSGNPFLAMVGVFLFNFTMPITLTAVSNLLPGRPGFAFGLTCLALLVGAFPVLLGVDVFSRELVMLVGIMLSVAAVWVALGPGMKGVGVSTQRRLEVG